MKVAMLTGGGDCPGLDAVLRAVVRRGEQHRFELVRPSRTNPFERAAGSPEP
jgi:6-phosphofructokinase